MINYERLLPLINASKNVAIISHVIPDGDTLGCGLAFQSVLLKMGKTVDFFCDGEVEDNLLKVLGNFKMNEQTVQSYDLAIAIDSSSFDRLGIYYNLFRKSKKRVVIDHHISHQKFGDIDFVEIRSATGEMIFDLVEKHYSHYIDEYFAKCIYLSILTDSGAFAFDSVSKETFEIISKLYNYKVNFANIYYELMRNQKLSTFKVQSYAKNKALFFARNQIAFITFSLADFQKNNGVESDTFGAINDIINIEEVKIAVSLTEVNARNFRVSVRTKGEISASEIAQSFGGGGHKNASGFRINGYLENVIDDILKVCKDNL